MNQLAVALSVLSAGFVACTTANPDHIKPGECRSAVDCAAPLSICELPSGVRIGTCVQCTAMDSAACTGTTPTCGTDNMCRGCTSHSECASNACLPNGSCGASADVAYVTPTGGGTDCSQSAPCSSVKVALATHRNFVKLSGSLSEGVAITNQNVTILAEPGTKLSAGTGYMFDFVGSSQVTIFDLEISSPNALGIRLSTSGTAVSLQRVTLRDMHSAIDMSGGTLNISQSTVRNNDDGITGFGGTINISESTFADNDRGMYVAGGTLNISRSTIRNNKTTGVFMADTATFHIVNNFIHHNGTPASSEVGGVRALPIGNSTLEFNTIVFNSATAAGAGGVACSDAAFVARNNLIYGNTSATAGTCMFDPLPSNTDPKFANPAENDYQLTANTPTTIRDAAICNGNTIDFSADPRPQGAMCDVGADEYKP